jgi:Fic family protein
MVSSVWRPIADLPEDWEDLARPDLDELLRQWHEERRYAAEPDRVRQLQERLANLWAIETGVIERLYTIDRRTTDSLVELGLDTIEQFSAIGRLTRDAARLIEDQRAALDFVVAFIQQGRPLTQSYIRELHQLLMRHQTDTDAVDQTGSRFQTDVIRGAWKRLPNTPTTADGSIHEYCPPDFVQDEMDRLLAIHERHLAMGVRPEIEAAWLHHRFTQIHPFQDGNGRVARALATMTFLKAGSVPLVVRDDVHREAYFDALGEADAGDLKSLVDLFANVVSADLNDAITFVRSAHGRNIGAIALAAANAAKRCATHDERSVRMVTDHYRKLAGTQLRDVASQLSRAFADAFPGLPSSQHAWIVSDDQEVRMSTGARGRWREQIVHAAGQYGYAPDLSQHKRWVALKLPGVTPDAQRWQIVVSLHHKESRAEVVAAVVFLTIAEDSDAGTPAADVVRPAILGAKHEFTHSGSHAHDERFLAWLDAALMTALEEWQSRI